MLYPEILKKNGGTVHAASNHPQAQADELDVYVLAGLMWARKWWLILGMATFALGAYFWNQKQPPVYEAMSIVQVGNGYSTVEETAVPLESLESIKIWILSDQVLMGLAREINYVGSFRSLRGAVKVTGDLRTVEFPELYVNISLKLGDMKQASDGVEYLVKQLVENHGQHYLLAISNLDHSSEISRRMLKMNQGVELNLKSEIDSTDAQILTDKNYVAALSKQTNEKQKLSINREMNETTIRFLEREKELADKRKQAIQLANEGENLRLKLLRIGNFKRILRKTVQTVPVQVGEDSRKMATGAILLYGAVAGFIVTFLAVYLLHGRRKSEHGA